MTKKYEPTKHEKWGATYLNTKMAAQFASPVIASGVRGMSGGLASVSTALRTRYTGPGLSTAAQGYASSLLQRWGDKKIGQAAALSRGSVTAILSEAIPVYQTMVDKKGQPLSAKFDGLITRTSGMNPGATADNFYTFDITQPTPYILTKYGLGILRKVSNHTRLLDPVKAGLSELGATF
jgi:hypothetical protein